jgi:hypothetical protein
MQESQTTLQEPESASREMSEKDEKILSLSLEQQNEIKLKFALNWPAFNRLYSIEVVLLESFDWTLINSCGLHVDLEWTAQKLV